MRVLPCAALFALPLVMSAQGSHRVDKCRAVAEPIGLVTATGHVAFLLGEDGRPDTASIRVTDVETIGPAGYRSVAVRLLSGCRFRREKGAGGGPRPVTLALDFDGRAEKPPEAIAVEQLPEGMPTPPAIVPTEGLPLSWDDRRLEEYPIAAPTCKAVFVGAPPAGLFTSMTNFQAALNAWGRARHARVTVTLEVRRDGSVPLESIQFEQSVNVDNPAKLATELARCRFIPGRMGGVPIDAQTRFRLGNR